jgi:hypothetical protein
MKGSNILDKQDLSNKNILYFYLVDNFNHSINISTIKPLEIDVYIF